MSASTTGRRAVRSVSVSSDSVSACELAGSSRCLRSVASQSGRCPSRRRSKYSFHSPPAMGAAVAAAEQPAAAADAAAAVEAAWPTCYKDYAPWDRVP